MRSSEHTRTEGVRVIKTPQEENHLNVICRRYTSSAAMTDLFLFRPRVIDSTVPFTKVLHISHPPHVTREVLLPTIIRVLEPSRELSGQECETSTVAAFPFCEWAQRLKASGAKGCDVPPSR